MDQQLHDATFGSIVSLEFRMGNYTDEVGWVTVESIDGKWTFDLPANLDILSQRLPIAVGDMVKDIAVANRYKPIRTGTVKFLSNGKAWVEWNSGGTKETLVVLHNIERFTGKKEEAAHA